MSLEAMLWVLDWAPHLPPHLVGTLMGLAERAGPDGRGAYPSQAELAWRARKTDRAVRNDLVQLTKLGLLTEGDQGLAAWIPADERPVVYDLPLHIRREPRPRRERNHSSGPMPGTGTTVPPETQRDRNHSSARDRNHSSDEPSEEPSSSSLARTRRPAALLATRWGIEEEEAQEIVQKIKTEQGVRAIGRYIARLIETGDIDNWQPRPAPPYTGPRCAFTADPDTPEVCGRCCMPKSHARHQNPPAERSNHADASAR